MAEAAKERSGAARWRCRVVISPNHETRAPSSADATGGRGRGGANIGEAGDADTAAIKPVIWPNTERRDAARNTPHTPHSFPSFAYATVVARDDTVNKKQTETRFSRFLRP